MKEAKFYLSPEKSSKCANRTHEEFHVFFLRFYSLGAWNRLFSHRFLASWSEIKSKSRKTIAILWKYNFYKVCPNIFQALFYWTCFAQCSVCFQCNASRCDHFYLISHTYLTIETTQSESERSVPRKPTQVHLCHWVGFLQAFLKLPLIVAGTKVCEWIRRSNTFGRPAVNASVTNNLSEENCSVSVGVFTSFGVNSGWARLGHACQALFPSVL